MKYPKNSVLILLTLIFTSCATSRITSSWNKKEYISIAKGKVLVMALLLKESDWSFREVMEEHLVDDLKSRGINARSSFKEYGPIALTNLTEEQALIKINNDTIDAVITIVLLNLEKERNLVPGYVTNPVYAEQYRCWWDYYGSVNNRVCAPDYYVIDTKYFWESNVYTGSKKELVYSAHTETFDPATSAALAHEYGKLLVKDMHKRKVF